MPDIVMSLPGHANAGWETTWRGISTVFGVKRDGLEDPVDENTATIKDGAPPKSALIQISKSARNLLHTHRLLHAYVVGIYNGNARIFRFDHAAGVVSKAINLKEDPYPLYEFLWRFCHYKHSNPPSLVPPTVTIPPHTETSSSADNSPPAETTLRPLTRSVTRHARDNDADGPSRNAGIGCFLGMDPTVFGTSEDDHNKVAKLLQESDPPQKPLTEEEKASCRWVVIVTEYNPDGSAKTVKWCILYRLLFLNPRLFSRATKVWEAYEVREDGQWERRAIKDAWRQLARDREDVLYRCLRDRLGRRDDLAKLVEMCKNFGLNDESSADVDDGRSDAPPPSTAVDEESEHELNDGDMPLPAEQLATFRNSLLYGLPDVEDGDDLGAREARKLFDSKHGNSGTQSAGATSSSSEADLDSLAEGDLERPPVYDVYHRTICAWLRDKNRKSARFNERSHMRLVMKTVGRPLSSFKSTKEMVTALRDAIIGSWPMQRHQFSCRGILTRGVCQDTCSRSKPD